KELEGPVGLSPLSATPPAPAIVFCKPLDYRTSLIRGIHQHPPSRGMNGRPGRVIGERGRGLKTC
ncbi:unnamed protein product, partial [Clonostachys chloroleuca]